MSTHHADRRQTYDLDYFAAAAGVERRKGPWHRRSGEYRCSGKDSTLLAQTISSG